MTTALLYRSGEPLPLQQAVERHWAVRRLFREGRVDPLAAVSTFTVLAHHPHERLAMRARLSLDELAIEDVDLTDNGVVAR